MSPQRLNLMIISKVKCLDLIYALIELEIIIKDRKILEMKEAEEMI